MLNQRLSISSRNTLWHNQQLVHGIPGLACPRQSIWLQCLSGSQTWYQGGDPHFAPARVTPQLRVQRGLPAAASGVSSSDVSASIGSDPDRNGSSSQAGSIRVHDLLPYPEVTDSYQQLLCDVLHIAPSDAQLILLVSPKVVILTPPQLRDNWDLLQQLLPVEQPLLMQAMLQLPDLLFRPQETVAARLQEASQVLQLPVHRLRSKQHRWTPLLHFTLISMQPQELMNKLVQLQQLLGLQQLSPAHSTQQSRRIVQQQRQHVVALVCSEPRLLHAVWAELLSTVEALEQVCAWPAARLLPALLHSPQLLMRPAGQLYAAAAALQQQLKLSAEGLALALKRAPGALLVPADQLRELLSELSLKLEVPIEVAADICLQEPQLLLRRPGAVGRVLTVLQSVFRLNPEQLLQVVEFDPSVLCRSPGDLSESSIKFRGVAHAYKPWAAEYKRLMTQPVNVARALRIEPLRLQRLVYLQRRRLARTVDLKAAVSMSGRQFAVAYPGYSSWLADRYSAGNAPKPFQMLQSDEEEEEE